MCVVREQLLEGCAGVFRRPTDGSSFYITTKTRLCVCRKEGSGSRAGAARQVGREAGMEVGSLMCVIEVRLLLLMPMLLSVVVVVDGGGHEYGDFDGGVGSGGGGGGSKYGLGFRV